MTLVSEEMKAMMNVQKQVNVQFLVPFAEYEEYKKMAEYMHKEGVIGRASVGVLSKASLRKWYSEFNEVLIRQAGKERYAGEKDKW